YAAGSWSCVNTGDNSSVTVTNSAVAVALAADITCTINNNDIAPKLTLKKTVDHNSTRPTPSTRTTPTATCALPTPPNLRGPTPLLSGGRVNPDPHPLPTRRSSDLYAAGSWSCVNTGDNSSVTVTNSAVAVALAADITCTINNNDIAPKLTLKKT